MYLDNLYRKGEADLGVAARALSNSSAAAGLRVVAEVIVTNIYLSGLDIKNRWLSNIAGPPVRMCILP